jgi:hypothetical protein
MTEKVHVDGVRDTIPRYFPLSRDKLLFSSLLAARSALKLDFVEGKANLPDRVNCIRIRCILYISILVEHETRQTLQESRERRPFVSLTKTHKEFGVNLASL